MADFPKCQGGEGEKKQGTESGIKLHLGRGYVLVLDPYTASVRVELEGKVLPFKSTKPDKT